MNALKNLTKFEWLLWGFSTLGILCSFLLTREKDILSLAAALIGAAALIFVAKGYVLGQVLTVIFSIFYGTVSFYFKYYGEMLTYLGMTAPMAVLSVISWSKNRYKEQLEVTVNRLSKKVILWLILSAPVVTAAFYFILNALGNANIFFSTISVTTSFIAAYLTFFRSPYYALGYAANDIVLIALWVMAALKEPYCTPMILCFVMFLFNDIYGFYNWKKMEKQQNGL